MLIIFIIIIRYMSVSTVIRLSDAKTRNSDSIFGRHSVLFLSYNAYRLALRPSLLLVKKSCRFFHRGLKMTVHVMCIEQFYQFNNNNNNNFENGEHVCWLSLLSNSQLQHNSHAHTLWLSTMLKINYLHGEITTITLPHFHLSNTDKEYEYSNHHLIV